MGRQGPAVLGAQQDKDAATEVRSSPVVAPVNRQHPETPSKGSPSSWLTRQGGTPGAQREAGGGSAEQ